MIQGNLVLEDIKIEFEVIYENNTVNYTVTDLLTEYTETLSVAQDKFFKALAIAVHNDGMPDVEKDYPDAESIMGFIRWIP